MIPPPELAYTLPPNTTPEEDIRQWLELTDDEFTLLFAGFREEGGEEEARAAFQEWYDRQMEEHDEKLFRMMRRYSDARKKNGF